VHPGARERSVGDAVECAVVDAADSARVVDHAVRLAALEDSDPIQDQLSSSFPASVLSSTNLGSV